MNWRRNWRNGRCSPGRWWEHNDLACCDKFDVMERVKEISIPSLVIVGADDMMTPVRYAEYLGRELQDAEVVVVPNSGHFVTLEQPEAVNGAVGAVSGATGRITPQRNILFRSGRCWYYVAIHDGDCRITSDD